MWFVGHSGVSLSNVNVVVFVVGVLYSIIDKNDLCVGHSVVRRALDRSIKPYLI